MKLKIGDKIDEMSLPSIDGTTFDLGNLKGKKALISFYRYSSCPFCHLRINETIKNKKEFGENFEAVAIFDCKFDDLVKSSRKHDGKLTILCDDDRQYFDKFSVQNSILKVTFGILFRVDRMVVALSKGFSPLSSMSGAFFGVPADILINEEGIVERVLYGSHTADHIPMKEVIEFSNA